MTTIEPTPETTPTPDLTATKTVRGALLNQALHIGLEKVLKESVDAGSIEFSGTYPTIAVVCKTSPRVKRKRAKKGSTAAG